MKEKQITLENEEEEVESKEAEEDQVAYHITCNQRSTSKK